MLYDNEAPQTNVYKYDWIILWIKFAFHGVIIQSVIQSYLYNVGLVSNLLIHKFLWKYSAHL